MWCINPAFRINVRLYVFAQVASSEWSLGIQIQHFENQLNAEIRMGQYCCCDIPDTCTDTLTGFAAAAYNCNKECKPYYIVRFQECTTDGICSTTHSLDFKSIPLSIVTKLVFPIVLDQSEGDNDLQVRAKFITNLRS